MSSQEPQDASVQLSLTSYQGQPTAGEASNNLGGREYLRLPDMCFTLVQGSTQTAALWFVGTVVISDATNMNIQSGQRPLWIVSLLPNGPADAPYTVDLSLHPWTMQIEECSLVVAFELGHGEEAAIRYFVKAPKKESFIHLINTVCLVKKCLISGF